MPELYSVKEAAQKASCSERYIRGEIYERRLSHIRLGRKVLIPADALAEYLKARTIASVKREC